MSGPLPLSVRARLLAKSLTPPIVWSALKRAKDSRRPPTPAAAEPEPPPEWEHVPEGWARPAGSWNAEAIAQAYREKWPSFLEATAGPGPLGVNHEVPAGVPVPRDELDAQHLVLAFGYVLARAAYGRERLSLLDWGGGPGHYAVLAAALLPEVELEYHSRDLPALVALGRELQLTLAFHDADACLGPRLRPRRRVELAPVLRGLARHRRGARRREGRLAVPRPRRRGARAPLVRGAAARTRLRVRDRVPRLGAEPRRASRRASLGRARARARAGPPRAAVRPRRAGVPGRPPRISSSAFRVRAADRSPGGQPFHVKSCGGWRVPKGRAAG